MVDGSVRDQTDERRSEDYPPPSNNNNNNNNNNTTTISPTNTTHHPHHQQFHHFTPISMDDYHQSTGRAITEQESGISLPSYHHQPSPPIPLREPSRTTKNTPLRYKTFNTAFGKISLNTLLRKDWIKYYILLVLIAVAAGLMTVYHHQIVIGLHPYVKAMRNLKVNNFEVGWLIPIGVLFIISFPPLFGHEIVIILCGLVWGLWLGFAIASAGTLLGELANYWVFKYACTKRANKLESTNQNFACLSAVVREGGFWIAFLARLSAIPGHLVTPVFATTGMSLFIFLSATILSMPKQLAGVYLGTLFNSDDGDQAQPKGSRIVKYSVLGLSFLVTIFAALYIYKRMAQVRSQVLGSEENLANSYGSYLEEQQTNNTQKKKTSSKN